MRAAMQAGCGATLHRHVITGSHAMSNLIQFTAFIALACCAQLVAAQAHDHAHERPTANAATAPIAGWATDAPLREGMRAIRDTVAGLGHHAMGHMSDAQAIDLSQRIDEQVKLLIANCKLDAAADAELHGIIARLLGDTAAFRGNPADPAALAGLRETLKEYPQKFDDPQWQALAD